MLILVGQLTAPTRYDAAVGKTADTHSGKSFFRVRSTHFLPLLPALMMQPGSFRLYSKWHDRGVAFATPSAMARRRWSWIQIQPFDNAALERLSLGVLAR